MSDNITKRIGLGTAYGFAKAGGYEGTVEEFTELLGNIAIDLARIENLSVTVTTLPAGSQATASLNGSVLSLGIPKGDTGAKGDTGNTPDFGIGTVTTLSAGSSATASITGTAENPVLNLGIPQGEAGAGAAGVTASAYSSSSTYAVGDYVIHNSNLYRCTTAITTAEAFTAAHWTQVVLADDVTDLKSDINQLNTSELSISQGYWAIADGTPATSANWCRTDAYIPKNYHLKSSSIRMFLLAYSNGIYVGTWDRTEFTQVYNESAHMEDIDITTWSENYPSYQFKIDFYAGGTPITPSDCQSSLSITTTEESIEARVETLETEAIPVIRLKQFTTDQNLIPFVKSIEKKYVVGVVGQKVSLANNNAYTAWIVPVEQKVYYMTRVTWWALVDESDTVLVGSGINGNAITSLDVSQYATAKKLYCSWDSANNYVSTTNGGSDNTFRLDGLVADAEIPNNNVFDIPSFKYITGVAWNMYFAGGWLRNAEYKRTSNGYKQYDDHFSYMANSAGDVNSTIRLYDNNFDSIGVHSMPMRYADPNYRNVTALFIGDSTINNGGLTAKILDVFTENSVVCTLLGTRGTGANKHEGRSGWTANDYCGHTSRGQDTSQNPFYNPSTQTFDFNYYMSQQGYSDPEFVFLQLGINDMFSAPVEEFKARYTTFKTNMLTIINSIHTYDSDIKIVVSLITMPNGNTTPFNSLYGCSYYNWERRYVDILTNSRLITDLPSYVLLNPHNLILDPMTNITDDVHPTAEGYAILGEFDANYMFAN